MATAIIALMQKDSRLKRANTRTYSAEEFIEFKFFKVNLFNFKLRKKELI